MGAMLATEEVASAFKPGSHGSTFSGTPLVSAAAVAVMKEMVKGDVLENCRVMGDRLHKGLLEIQKKTDRCG